MFVSWRDPQRPIWGVDWPYQVRRPLGTPPPSGPPPSQRVPIEYHDPQRPVWGVSGHYGYVTRSQAPAPEASIGPGPGVPTPPPGSPWGNTGQAAPDLEAYGLYETWRPPKPVQIAALITPPYVPAPQPTSTATLNAIIGMWPQESWATQVPIKAATVQPPPPATPPPPHSLVTLFQIRLTWDEPSWPAQKALQKPDIGLTLVPNVVGLTEGQAIALLLSVPLLPIISALSFSQTVPRGYIISQVPAAGTSVTVDSVVQMVLSLGIAPGTLPTPFPKVSYRSFSWLEMVEQAWGSAYREPDHRIYVFSDGRAFDSTDMYQTGIYRKPS